MVVARLKARGHTLSELAVGQPPPPWRSGPGPRSRHFAVPRRADPVPERFIRRLKEQLLWLRTFQIFEKVGMQRHKRLAAYSQQWLVERQRHRSTDEARVNLLALDQVA